MLNFEVKGDFLQLQSATVYQKKKGNSCTVSLTKAISELKKGIGYSFKSINVQLYP